MEAGTGLVAKFLGLGVAHQQDAGRTVGDLRGVPSVDHAAFLERRLQVAQALHGGRGADALVHGEVFAGAIAFSVTDLDLDDLVIETAFFGCDDGTTV